MGTEIHKDGGRSDDEAYPVLGDHAGDWDHIVAGAHTEARPPAPIHRVLQTGDRPVQSQQADGESLQSPGHEARAARQGRPHEHIARSIETRRGVRARDSGTGDADSGFRRAVGAAASVRRRQVAARRREADNLLLGVVRRRADTAIREGSPG